MKVILEGSKAVARCISLCRPKIVCAYPITPQTHIVESLAAEVANGHLSAKYLLVESEFAAASVILGASATGARVYTATSSQGLLLMTEVIFNIAGLRLPAVMTVANRAVSGPINIWNDQQDSMSLRDCGWIQMYAEDIQEACDMHIQAFMIAEKLNLPVMVCMDGYILTHAMETIDLPDTEQVDRFLPPYEPKFFLTPDDPITLGSMAGPDAYMDIRLLLHQAMQQAPHTIKETAEEFHSVFGRFRGDLLDEYKSENAEVLLVSMGSVIGTMKDAVDELRDEGHQVGIIRLRTNRPFPRSELHDALRGAKVVGVIEKDVSLGLEGILASEIRSAFCGADRTPKISSFVVGLGGRDVKIEDIKEVAIGLQKDDTCRVGWVGIDDSVLKEAHWEE